MKFLKIACMYMLGLEEKENANERQYTQIKAKALLYSSPQAYCTNISVHLRFLFNATQ